MTDIDGRAPGPGRTKAPEATGRDWGPDIRRVLASVPLRPVREAEIVEELSQHLDDAYRELVAAGADPDAAARTALAELTRSDRLPRYLTALRQARRQDPTPPFGAWLPGRAGLGADLRQAVRSLLTHPGYALVCLATLSLGIGANAATFTMANWLLFRPIPGVREPSALVTIVHATGDLANRSPISIPDTDAIAAGTPALSGVAGFADLGGALAVTAAVPGQSPQRVEAEAVSANYFTVLDVPLSAGRAFSDAEGRDQSLAPVAVVSDWFFETSLHGDPRTLDRTILINDRAVAVVGVAARGFRGARLTQGVDVWLPVAQRPIAVPAGGPAALSSRRTGVFFALVGRVRPGQTIDAVRQQVRAVEAGLVTAHPSDRRFDRRHLSALDGLQPFGTDPAVLAETLRLLLAFSGLLFLLACANVGNAVLARAATRGTEIATRLALGASRARVARMLLVESLLLSLVSGAAALAVAWGVAAAMKGSVLLAGATPLGHAELDWRVILLGVGLAALATLATALWPVLATTRLRASALRAGASSSPLGSRTLQRGLMVLQVALSVVLLIGATLLVRSVSAKLSVSPGFDDARVLTFAIDPPRDASRPPAVIARDVIDRVREVPGVRSASRAFLPPFYSGVEARIVLKADLAAEPVTAMLNSVDDHFFAAIGLPIVAGRAFTRAELASTAPAGQAPVILTESLARRLFGARAAVGAFVLTPNDGRQQVVGVVRDTRQRQLLSDDSADVAFRPFQSNFATPWTTMVVGVSSPTVDMWPQLRAAVERAEPTLAIFNTLSARDGIRGEFVEDLLIMRLTVIFGALALAMAVAGLYGVMARRVGEREREFGVRAALGANPAKLAAHLAVEAAGILLVGAAIGLAAGAWSSRFLESRLYGLSRLDALSFAGALAVVAVAMTVAAVPASRRAAAVDPARTLRA
jgi:predicted permease